MTEPVSRPATPAPLEVPERPKRHISRGLIAIVALALALIVIAVVGGTAWSYNSSIQTEKRLVAEMDRFVAQQYPDYRVVQREMYADYHGSGAPGNDYFLVRRSEPRFVLLLTVLKTAKIDDQVLHLKFTPNGDYLTSDGVFRKKAIDDTWLQEPDIDQVIADYVSKRPSPSALIINTDQTEGSVLLMIAGRARYSQGPGYISPFIPTHIGQDTQTQDTSGEESVTKWEYVVTVVER